jgi:hypothetical protein
MQISVVVSHFLQAIYCPTECIIMRALQLVQAVCQHIALRAAAHQLSGFAESAWCRSCMSPSATPAGP